MVYAVAERSVIKPSVFDAFFGMYHGRIKGLTLKPAREGSGGVIGSENVDMSSDKECERHSRRKSKGSCLKLI